MSDQFVRPDSAGGGSGGGRRSERLYRLKQQLMVTNDETTAAAVIADSSITANGQTSSGCRRQRQQQPGQQRRRSKYVVKCEKCLAKIGRQLKTKRWYDLSAEKWLRVCGDCAKHLSATAAAVDKYSSAGKVVNSPAVVDEIKRKYLDSCSAFGRSLSKLLANSAAERLYCPTLRPHSGTACACVQQFIIGDQTSSDQSLAAKQLRAQQLLDLQTKGKRLSQQKCYPISVNDIGGDGYQKTVGLGNGHKKSAEFEAFVKTQRQYLRAELRFCERAAQRVIGYSNNFLHKKLKTEPIDGSDGVGGGGGRQRVVRQRGKAATGKLRELSDVAADVCCPNRCQQLCKTHPELVNGWRQRAIGGGQLETRRVLAEMLTPAQGERVNCRKFIASVTGSSSRTIDRVDSYMRSNGGRREPQEHGLKRYWIRSTTGDTVAVDSSSSGGRQTTTTTDAAVVDLDYGDEEAIVHQLAPNLLLTTTTAAAAADDICATFVDGIVANISSITDDDNDRNGLDSNGQQQLQQQQQQQRIHLLVNQMNNEISVINTSGRHQMIAIVGPPFVDIDYGCGGDGGSGGGGTQQLFETMIT
ncbi:uncharacterized protein LOC128963833 [Oppia nitens]|uniref:uncharacterized protein LOC128963833 n=1 Tax=Oppia nitens TaxID=1686743 RepID=UPI0023DA88F7|nr:uncharacterized protein LOC128963833 [Oppia nitens]